MPACGRRPLNAARPGFYRSYWSSPSSFQTSVPGPSVGVAITCPGSGQPGAGLLPGLPTRLASARCSSVSTGPGASFGRAETDGPAACRVRYYGHESPHYCDMNVIDYLLTTSQDGRNFGVVLRGPSCGVSDIFAVPDLETMLRSFTP